MNLQAAKTLEALGKLLSYPGKESEELLAEAALRLSHASAARTSFQVFAGTFRNLSSGDRESLYTQTFDLSPVCPPYVGICLFGEENFQRAELMARLREAYLDKGFDDGGDLPDHIALLLQFIPRLYEANARELFEYCLRQPMAEMALKLKKADSPYFYLLEAAFEILSAEFQKEPARV